MLIYINNKSKLVIVMFFYRGIELGIENHGNSLVLASTTPDFKVPPPEKSHFHPWMLVRIRSFKLFSPAEMRWSDIYCFVRGSSRITADPQENIWLITRSSVFNIFSHVNMHESWPVFRIESNNLFRSHLSFWVLDW